MNVLHLISGGDVGGAKTHVLTLLEGLGHTDRVRLVCFMEGPFAQEAMDLGIDTVVLPSKNMLHNVRVLSSMVRKDGFEIIHCHGSRANLVGTLLRGCVHLPVITTVHSDYKLDYLGRPLHRITYGSINTFCLHRFRYHIGVSDVMTRLLISRGFDPQNIFTIYNGVAFPPPSPELDRDAFFKSIGLSVSPNDVVFGIAARLSPVKDIGTLLRGFADACKQVSNIRLVIAGDGESRKELETLAAEICPKGTYAFAGWVKDTDSFYHAIDVNTLTSISEGFPYALPEGARMRCATIATRVGGVPVIIEHGKTGLLLDPGDVKTLTEYMVTLAQKHSYRLQLADQLYERASRDFSIDATVERQREIYEVLLRRWNRKKGKRDGILICGAYGKGNAGDDSILEAILGQIRRIDPDIPVCVLSRNPKETKLRYRIQAVHTFSILRFLRIMCKTQLYINGGGSLIQDVTSTRSLRYYLSNIAMASICGNRVLMYGCGIGPVSSAKNRRSAGSVINRYVDMITLRDPQSAEELSSMQVTKPEIRITADPALLLDPSPDEAVDAFLKECGVDPDEKYAMFVLRPWDGLAAAQKNIASVAKRLLLERGLKPVFFALEPGRDLEVSRTVAAMVGENVPVIAAPHDGHLIVGMMRRMDVLISMRLHALIFAAGQGTPLVGIVYDPKVSGFMDYLNQGRYLSVDQVQEETLMDLIVDALEAGTDLDAVDRLRSLAAENEAAARQLLDL